MTGREDAVGFKYDSLKKKKVMKKKNFTDVELAMCEFNKLLSDKIGFDSKLSD
jgi:hypothetical protein